MQVSDHEEYTGLICKSVRLESAADFVRAFSDAKKFSTSTGKVGHRIVTVSVRLPGSKNSIGRLQFVDLLGLEHMNSDQGLRALRDVVASATPDTPLVSSPEPFDASYSYSMFTRFMGRWKSNRDCCIVTSKTRRRIYECATICGKLSTCENQWK